MEHPAQNPSTSKERPKQKIFQIAQKNLATTLGTNQNAAMQMSPLNRRICMGFLVMGSFIICNSEFTLYEAKTFAEYTQSICAGSAGVFIIFEMFFLVLSLKKLCKLMNDCENLVNAGEYAENQGQLRNSDLSSIPKEKFADFTIS